MNTIIGRDSSWLPLNEAMPFTTSAGYPDQIILLPDS